MTWGYPTPPSSNSQRGARPAGVAAPATTAATSSECVKRLLCDPGSTLTRAVPPEELDGVVATVCGQLATGAAQGLRESKRILNADLVRRIDALGDDMAALSARLFASDDARTAMRAFLDRKR